MSWPALLDAIDEGLAASPPVLVDFAPAEFGPLPAHLALRAGATLQRMAEVEAAWSRAHAELSRELIALSAAKVSVAAPVPHFLDTKA